MLVYMNFQNDFEEMVLSKLRECGGKSKSAAKAFAMLVAYEARQVPERKYKVHFSPDLLASPHWLAYEAPIHQIAKLLKHGKPVTHLLSTSSAKVSAPDRLLAYWGINHLHPVRVDSSRNPWKPAFTKDRSDHLLYFRVKEGNFYLIDLLPHPPKNDPESWIDAHLVRVVDRHWPHLHALYEPHPAAADVLTDEEHKAVFSNGANALISTARGLVLPSGGLMVNRKTSLEAQARWMGLVAALRALQDHVAKQHEAIFPRSGQLVRALTLTQVEAGGRRFHVFDGLSKTQAIFQVSELGFEVVHP